MRYVMFGKTGLRVSEYGERWRDVDDRRFTARRVPGDDPELLRR